MTAHPSNLPPDVDPLRERLDETYAHLAQRTAELVAAAGRVPAKLDDETLRTATDFVAKQLKPHGKKILAARVDEKEPFLSGGRIVDGFFGEQAEQLKRAILLVETSINARLIIRAAEERKHREEQAAKARAEAEAAAAAMATETDLEDAVAAEQAAAEVALQAHASAADLARTHGAHGGVATLRTSVGFEVTDHRSACTGLWAHFDAAAVEKAIRSHIRSRGDTLKAQVAAGDVHEHGVRFFNEEKALIR